MFAVVSWNRSPRSRPAPHMPPQKRPIQIIDFRCRRPALANRCRRIGPSNPIVAKIRCIAMVRRYGGSVRYVVSLKEVAQAASELPEVVEGERHGNRSWSVGGKVFAWERSFSKADIKRFGTSTVPDGPILAVRTADLHEKEAVLAAGHKG